MTPALSMLAKAVSTLEGRKVAVLLTNGFDAAVLSQLRRAVTKEKAALVTIAPKVGGATSAAGKLQEVDFALSAAPSFFFDALVILASAEGAKQLMSEAAAIAWVSDGFSHLKVLGHTAEAAPLLKAARVKTDNGVVPIDEKEGVQNFIKTAKKGRIWKREPQLRSPG